MAWWGTAAAERQPAIAAVVLPHKDDIERLAAVVAELRVMLPVFTVGLQRDEANHRITLFICRAEIRGSWEYVHLAHDDGICFLCLSVF